DAARMGAARARPGRVDPAGADRRGALPPPRPQAVRFRRPEGNETFGQRQSRRTVVHRTLMRLLMGILLLLHGTAFGADWRTASQAPVGLAPDPATTPE